MIVERSEVKKEDMWNVEALYTSEEAWQKEFEKIEGNGARLRWPEIHALRGKLGESAEQLKRGLDLIFEIDRRLSKLYTYAHLRHDENLANDEYKGKLSRITSLLHDFAREAAWVEPELLALPGEKIKELLASPELEEYRFHLEKVLRIKPHTLPPEQEELMALGGQALQTPHKAFGALNNADFQFGSVEDGKGEKKELSHAAYSLYLHSRDRTLRKNAYEKMHLTFRDHENGIGELLSGQVQAHLFNARARKYPDCLEAALYPKNIDSSVYHALIEAVGKNLPALHRYYERREERMGIGPLHLYDMYVPLVEETEIALTYREAEELIIESAAPLGGEYQEQLKKGLQEQRWVDRFENRGKRSGGYSSGCYDSYPYILMNYKELLRDVFTLAHEAGHSMHSQLSKSHQPYHYSSYPIFLAEVASTFNEQLLTRTLLEKFTGKEERAFILNEKVEEIRATLFRQTMFAEFELQIHQMAERGEPLTPTALKEAFFALNSKYFGPKVQIDEIAKIEWARIPHFYFNFYVYQYSTGISAALALSERVLQGGKKEREEYLGFLKSGCSRYPIETLERAGVDMRSPEPVAAAIAKFDGYVNQLFSTLKS